MTTFLLDLNVLIALLDPGHIHTHLAHQWFMAEGEASWATCPITQNGLLRILGSPRYVNSPGSPAAVAGMMKKLCGRPGHTFWSDDISLLDVAWAQSDRLLSHNQVTDTYLLALAKARGGKLATFDRRLVTDAVAGGASALHLIG